MKPLPKVKVLKIDKDCFVESRWLEEYRKLVLRTCQSYRILVRAVRVTLSRRKGQHIYIQISPPVEPELANRLQWLLGDDCNRVDFNRARIRSRLPEWNKLFEEPNRRMRTIYRRPGHSLKHPFRVH